MTHGSVFSGIGGPEVAASMLGWENLFHCEINPFGRQILDYYYPNAESYEDITKTDFTKWRGRINVLTGGFPCQPFSYAGQRRGAEDDRYLWPYMFRCIDQIQPDWVVCENVAGITTMVEQGEVTQMASAPTLFDTADDVRGRYMLRETFTLQRICDDLEGHGYSVQPILIPACAVGAPHRRDRVFIVGHRELATDTESVGQFDGDRQGRRAVAGRPHLAQAERSVNASVGNGEQEPAADTDGIGGASRSEGAEGNRPRANDIQGQAGRGQGHSPVWADGLSAVLQSPADTDGERRQESEQPGRGAHQAQDGAGMDNRTQRPCADGAASYTDNIGQSGRCSKDWGQRSDFTAFIWRELFGFSERRDGYEVGERWNNFPSVSPVHRGNDGIPFDVDCLAVPPIPAPPTYGKGDPQKYPFSKWRTESLKAYGNAIVPQVMYEIFRAIEIVEQSAQSE